MDRENARKAYGSALNRHVIATRELQNADDAWIAKLKEAFGENAERYCDMPEGKGKPGSDLNRLYLAFCKAKEKQEETWAELLEAARESKKTERIPHDRGLTASGLG